MSKYQSPSVKVNVGAAKIVVGAIILLIIIGIVAGASVKIVESGNRGVLTQWSAVDLTSHHLQKEFIS